MVFRGTAAVYGRGVAAVTATGMGTELGRIAELIQEVEDEKTPLQRRLDQLGRVLVTAAIAIVAVVFGLGMLRGEPARFNVPDGGSALPWRLRRRGCRRS